MKTPDHNDQQRGQDTSAGTYFRFEQDFVEKSIRCIPMIVRFKMDAVGIKLKLEEWSRFSVDERYSLAMMRVDTQDEIKTYREYLSKLVKNYTGKEVSTMIIDAFPLWAELDFVPISIQEKAGLLGIVVTIEAWRSLNTLQRFALVKLSREGHESKNFPVALKEFGWV